MVVVSIEKGKDPYSTTVRALNNLIEAGVKIPETAVIKPNLLHVDFDDCCNTRWEVCRVVADFAISQGSKGLVCAEGSTSGQRGDTMKAFKICEYEKIDEISRFIDLNLDDPGKWMKISSPGLSYEVELALAKSVVGRNIASVAKFKTHDCLGLTLTLKNMMGAICQARRLDDNKVLAVGRKSKIYMHGWGQRNPDKLPLETNIGPSKAALAKNLVSLAYNVTPKLAIIDGIVAMEGDGPLDGERKELGLILASTDPVACDVVACDIAGFNSVETGYIYAAGKAGLGEYRLENIEIVGEAREKVKNNFKPHRLYQNSKFSLEEAENLVDEIVTSQRKG